MSLNAKVAAYIGFSIKAGKLIYGYENVIASKKVRLILCDTGISENSMKKVQRYADEVKINVITIEDLAEYFGGKPVKCIGLVEENLASATEKELLGRR